MNTSNPVIQQAAGVTALIVVIKSFISYIRVMGWWSLDEHQYQETITFIETVLPIVVIWLGAWWTTRKVTSLKEPKDIDGVSLTRPDNTPAIPELKNLRKEAEKINQALESRRIRRK